MMNLAFGSPIGAPVRTVLAAVGLLATLLAASVAVVPANAFAAQPLSATGAQRIGQIRQLLATIVEHPEWAKGQIDDRTKAESEIRNAQQALRSASRLYQTLGIWDQKTPEAREIAQALQAKTDYVNAVIAAANAGAGSAGAEGRAGAASGGGSAGGAAAGDGAAGGGALSSAVTYFLKNMHANFDGVEPDHAFCAGTFLVQQDRDAGQFGSGIDRGMSFAQMAAARLSDDDRQHPEVAAKLKKLEGLVACKAAIAARRKVIAGEQAALKDRYFAFMRDAQPYGETARRLIVFAAEPENPDLTTPNADELHKWRQDLDAIHALCTGKYPDMHNDARYGLSADRDPEQWCKLGANREGIVRRLAMNHVRRAVQMQTDWMKALVKDFEKREGYLITAGEVSSLALETPEVLKARFKDENAALLKEAGIGEAPELWADFDAARTALWAKIDESAPKWKRPASQGAGPGAANARTAFAKVEGGAKVLTAYITRSEWQIIKNGFGVPLRRTQPGYVVYKTKRDPKWCRGRSWTYKEQFDGRGYQKSNEVSEFGYIRFESCK